MKKRTLNKIHFHRIVLDEAHQIKNITTRVTKSILGLHARNKWALTGYFLKFQFFIIFIRNSCTKYFE